MITCSLDACAVHPTSGRSQFTLRSMMLLVLWMAAALAIGRSILVLGIVFLLATAPALVRTRRFVVQTTARGLTLETPVVARVFLSSLGITALIAATTLGLAINTSLVITIFSLAAAARLCRITAAGSGRPDGVVRRWVKRTMHGTGRLLATGRRLRRSTKIIRWPGVLAASIGTIIGLSIAGGLLMILATLGSMRLATACLARFHPTSRRLLRRVTLGTAHLVAVERQLLQRFCAC